MKFTIIFIAIMATFSLSAQTAEELTEKGKVKANMGKDDEAIELYSEAIAKDPKHLDAYIKRAFSLIRLKEYEKAISDYNVIIENRPDNIYAYLGRGSALNKLEKYKEAISDFDQALSLDPDNQEAYNNRGWAKKGLGDQDGACKDWKESKKRGNREAKIIMKNNDC